VDREESVTPTCALNSTLIGMYKGNVLGFMHTHRFIYPDIFVRRSAFGFERAPCFSRKSTQVFVHEAPALSLFPMPSLLSLLRTYVCVFYVSRKGLLPGSLFSYRPLPALLIL